MPDQLILDFIPDPGISVRDPDWQAKALLEQAVPPDRRPSSIPGFTVEEASYIQSYAVSMARFVDSRPPVGKYMHADRWERWIFDGALTHLYRLPTIQAGRGVDICMTVTKLGWLGGFHFRGAEGSYSVGDSCHPEGDAIGRYFLTTYEAAGRAGLHRLYTDQHQAGTKFAEKLRAHFLAKGHDISDPIPDDVKRRIFNFDTQGAPHV